MLTAFAALIGFALGVLFVGLVVVMAVLESGKPDSPAREVSGDARGAAETPSPDALRALSEEQST